MERWNTDVRRRKFALGPVLGRFVFGAAILAAVFGLVAAGPGAAQEDPSAMPEETGRRFAEAALAYAEVVYVVEDEERQGMPYAWGGRTRLDAFRDMVTGGEAEGSLSEGVGVDASGLVVAALRDVMGDVRFRASAEGDVLWADATSALLYEWNATPVDPAEARAGDLVFFGTVAEDGTVTVEGVGVVTGVSGTRVDFVVASAGQGRVVHTFARTDGEYWRDNILGIGLLTLPGV